jgi:hypothetical protein
MERAISLYARQKRLLLTTSCGFGGKVPGSYLVALILDQSAQRWCFISYARMAIAHPSLDELQQRDE